MDDYIASIRHSTPGVGLISPPPHHDIYSIEDIAQLIHDLKNAQPSSAHQRKAGRGGGRWHRRCGRPPKPAPTIWLSPVTPAAPGASPLTSIKHAGVPWELGIAETHQTLVMNNLRSMGRPTDRRPTKDRARCGDCGPAWRGGVRFRDGATHRPGLHNDAQVSISIHAPLALPPRTRHCARNSPGNQNTW